MDEQNYFNSTLSFESPDFFKSFGRFWFASLGVFGGAV